MKGTRRRPNVQIFEKEVSNAKGNSSSSIPTYMDILENVVSKSVSKPKHVAAEQDFTVVRGSAKSGVISKEVMVNESPFNIVVGLNNEIPSSFRMENQLEHHNDPSDINLMEEDVLVSPLVVNGVIEQMVGLPSGQHSSQC